MADDILEKIEELLDKKIKPIHTEVARLTQEVRDVKGRNAEIYLETRDLRGDMARVESKVDNAQESLDDPETGLKALKEGQDALTADMFGVQKVTNVTYEYVKFMKERYDQELDEIRDHSGMEQVKRESLGSPS